MAKKRTKKKPPELKVVFDTNALYTKVASDLFNHAVTELIKENSNHPDLKITWCLPDVVMHERQYQMQRKGFELFPAIQKLERLLGQGIGINEEIIKDRVRAAIEKHIKDYNIKLVNLNTDSVDWNRIKIDAAYRRPPFEAGDKEKGFRDALITETFMQIVSGSPATPKICRIALVSDDRLLRDAVKDRSNHLENVRLLSSLGELESLISTLISEVKEEFVERIKEIAESYFYKPDEEATLFYKEKIVKKIVDQFRAELDALPEGANYRLNGNWDIGSPGFVKKIGRRVFWASRIEVEASAYRYRVSESLPVDPFLLSSIPQSAKWSFSGSSTGQTSQTGPPKLVSEGKSVFEVVWTVMVIGKQEEFSSPRIESIKFIETSWDEVGSTFLFSQYLLPD